MKTISDGEVRWAQKHEPSGGAMAAIRISLRHLARASGRPADRQSAGQTADAIAAEVRRVYIAAWEKEAGR
jgi:hypothetical protein